MEEEAVKRWRKGRGGSRCEKDSTYCCFEMKEAQAGTWEV